MECQYGFWDKEGRFLHSICENANGSYRNAISILESVIKNDLWKDLDSVNDLLGIISNDSIGNIINGMIEGKPEIFGYKYNQQIFKKIQWQLNTILKMNLGFKT
jgi:DNA polymerase III gamma/tau subunit